MTVVHTTTVSSFKPHYTALAIPLPRDQGELIPMGYLDELSALRKKRGLSQAELAELVGVEQPTIQRWEKGKRMPDLDNLTSLAKALGVTAGKLLDGGTLVALGPTLWVKGEVAAGKWLPAFEWPEDEWEAFTGSPDVTANIEHRFGLRLSGDSMNLLYPHGSVIECISTFGRSEPSPGKRVVIVRRNDKDEFEATVKELVEENGKLWAVPRSTNPAHLPIDLSEPEPGILETRIVAVVVASTRPE